MKWIFVVTWCLVAAHWETVPVYDKFNRYSYSYDTVALVVDCNNYKEFDNPDSAYAFFLEASKAEGLDKVTLTSRKEVIDTISWYRDIWEFLDCDSCISIPCFHTN